MLSKCPQPSILDDGSKLRNGTQVLANRTKFGTGLQRQEGASVRSEPKRNAALRQEDPVDLHIDEKGNLVIVNLRQEILRRLQSRLDDAKMLQKEVGSESPLAR
jgi:hypothetical protein